MTKKDNLKNMEQRLEQSGYLSDSKDQINSLQLLTDEAISAHKYGFLRNIVTKILATGSGFSQQAVKVVIIYIAQQLGKFYLHESFEDIASFFIMTIKQQQTGGVLDEADYIARETFFQYYLHNNQFKDAALILAGINVDSTSFVISNVDKANIYLKCAECCLEDDESVDAEVFVNRASPFMNDITDRQLQLRFRATSARVLDSNRKFLEAADRYYELSSASDTGICQEDLLELLGKAITCAILAKVGPRRSRIMKQLIKDDKLHSLEQVSKYTAHTVILTKMNHIQLLSKDELHIFLSSLQPHQKAMTSDGFTIPEKAIIEHNLTAVAKVYDNIKLSELGILLGLEGNRTEKVVAKMISEDRLKATIDQTLGMVQFVVESGDEASYDNRIKDICNGVSNCVDRIQNTL